MRIYIIYTYDVAIKYRTTNKEYSFRIYCNRFMDQQGSVKHWPRCSCMSLNSSHRFANSAALRGQGACGKVAGWGWPCAKSLPWGGWHPCCFFSRVDVKTING